MRPQIQSGGGHAFPAAWANGQKKGRGPREPEWDSLEELGKETGGLRIVNICTVKNTTATDESKSAPVGSCSVTFQAGQPKAARAVIRVHLSGCDL